MSQAPDPIFNKKNKPKVIFDENYNLGAGRKLIMLLNDHHDKVKGVYINDPNSRKPFVKLSPRPFRINKRIVCGSDSYLEIEYLANAKGFVKTLLDTQSINSKSGKIFQTLAIPANRYQDFVEAIIYISTDPDNGIPVIEQSSTKPGWADEATNFLKVGVDATDPMAEKVFLENGDAEEGFNNFKSILNESDLLRKMLPAAIAGFLAEPLGLEISPIYSYRCSEGSSGKTSTSELLYRLLTDTQIFSFNSTNSGIERYGFSRNSTFIVGDEVDGFVRTKGKEALGARILDLVNGGRRVVASGSDAGVKQLNFKLSLLTLSNTSLYEHLRGHSEEEAITSRIFEVKFKSEKKREDFINFQMAFAQAKSNLDKNYGWGLSLITDYIIENLPMLLVKYYQKQQELIELFGDTNNGRLPRVVALYLVSNQVMKELFDAEISQSEIDEMLEPYLITQEEKADDYLSVLQEVFNAYSYCMDVSGYLATKEEHLVGSDKTLENGEVITIKPEDKQIRNSETHNNRNRSHLGRVVSSKIMKADFHSIMDFKEICFTNGLLERLNKDGVSLNLLVDYCKKVGALKVDKGRSKKTVSGYGKCLVIDIKKLTESLQPF